MISMVSFFLLLHLELLLLDQSSLNCINIFHHESERCLQLIDEDANLLHNTYFVSNFSIPHGNFSLPLLNLVLFIINHKKDTRCIVIVLFGIKPEFLIDREIRLLDIIHWNLCLENVPSLAGHCDMNKEWLTVIINVESYFISECRCWPYALGVCLARSIALIHYNRRNFFRSNAQVFGFLNSHFEHASRSMGCFTVVLLCIC